MSDLTEKELLEALRDWHENYTLPLRVCNNKHQLLYHKQAKAQLRVIVEGHFSEEGFPCDKCGAPTKRADFHLVCRNLECDKYSKVVASIVLYDSKKPDPDTEPKQVEELVEDIIFIAEYEGVEHDSKCRQIKQLLTRQPQKRTVTRGEIYGAVARGWCHHETKDKEMDVVLATAIAKEVCKELGIEVVKE